MCAAYELYPNAFTGKRVRDRSATGASRLPTWVKLPARMPIWPKLEPRPGRRPVPSSGSRWGNVRGIPPGRGPWHRDFGAGCRVCRHGVGVGADPRIGRRGGGRRSWADPGWPGKSRDGGTEGPRRKGREPPVNESVGDPGITVCDRTDLDCCRSGHRCPGRGRPGGGGARGIAVRGVAVRGIAVRGIAVRGVAEIGFRGIFTGVAEPVIRSADHMTEAPRMARGLSLTCAARDSNPGPAD